MKIQPTTFRHITSSDLTITKPQLKEQILSELSAGRYAESLIAPVIEAMSNMIRDVDNDLSRIHRHTGLYIITKAHEPYSITIIQDKTLECESLIPYVFSDEELYQQSIVPYILDAFQIPYSVQDYRTAVKHSKVTQEHQNAINHAIELSTNLFDYLKKEGYHYDQK